MGAFPSESSGQSGTLSGLSVVGGRGSVSPRVDWSGPPGLERGREALFVFLMICFIPGC